MSKPLIEHSSGKTIGTAEVEGPLIAGYFDDDWTCPMVRDTGMEQPTLFIDRGPHVEVLVGDEVWAYMSYGLRAVFPEEGQA